MSRNNKTNKQNKVGMQSCDSKSRVPANRNKSGYPRGSRKQGDLSKDIRRETEIINTAKRGRKSDYELSTSNPYSPWYDRFPQFTKDAGTLAFGIPLGQPITIPGGDKITVPGVMALGFYPGIGYSADNMSPINRSVIRFYTYLRDIQKAAAKYDPADVMMYILTLDSAYMFYYMCRRAYGVANLFTPVNKYYPKVLLRAMGFDDSITENLADFRMYINRFAISLGSYTIPEGIEFCSRHEWMCSGLYTDSDSTRAQTYVFVPEGFWKYNNTVETGSQLDFVAWLPQQNDLSTRHSLSDIMSIGNSLLNAIVGDQDTGNISGDIYSAFKGRTKKLMETAETLMILPAYDKTVLSQINNATLVGLYDASYTPVITQDPSINNGAIIYTPVFAGSSTVYSNALAKVGANALFTYPAQFINYHGDSPTLKTPLKPRGLWLV